MAGCEEEYVLFPTKFVERAQPFGVDFGGSVIKIAYKVDHEVPDDNGQSRVYLRQYSREDLPKAVTFLKKTVTLPDPAAPPEDRTFCLTGVGTFEYGDMFEKELGIKIKNIWEMVLTQRMFRYLVTTQPDEQIFFPPLHVRDESIEQLVEGMRGMIGPNPEFLPAWEHSGFRKWPCLMLVLGSAFVFNPMFEDGRVMPGLFSSVGGRSFLGMGTLLTQAKTFDELVELAAAGDDHTVNTYMKDIAPDKHKKEGVEEKQDGGVYSTMTQDVNVFSWGWAVNKDRDVHKREDLAKALLVNTSIDIIQKTLLLARASECTNIILLGGFPKNNVVRDHLESVFIKEQGMSSIFDPNSSLPSATFRTLRAGCHLGALGAMFSDVDLGEAFKMPDGNQEK